MLLNKPFYIVIVAVVCVVIAVAKLSDSILKLRANVTIGQTFRGNSSKFNLAHILRLGRP